MIVSTNNTENRTCRLSQFRCDTGLCIDRALRCNEEPECPDRSDEMQCCNVKIKLLRSTILTFTKLSFLLYSIL